MAMVATRLIVGDHGAVGHSVPGVAMVESKREQGVVKGMLLLAYEPASPCAYKLNPIT